MSETELGDRDPGILLLWPVYTIAIQQSLLILNRKLNNPGEGKVIFHL